ERAYGDVRGVRGAGRSQGVVAGLRAGQAQAGGDHLFAVADVLVGEERRAASQGHVIARNRIAQRTVRDGSRGIAVVDLVCHGDAAGDDADADVGSRRRTGRGQRIIGSIRPGGADSGDGDLLVRTHVRVSEIGADVAVGEVVTRYPVVGQGHRRVRCAVVSL